MINHPGRAELAQAGTRRIGRQTGEVRSQLYAALDLGYLGQDGFDELYDLATRTSRKLGALIRYLRPTPA